MFAKLYSYNMYQGVYMVDNNKKLNTHRNKSISKLIKIYNNDILLQPNLYLDLFQFIAIVS